MIELLTSTFALSSAIALCAGWGGATLYHHMRTKRARLRVTETVKHLGEGYFRSSLDGKQLTGNPALARMNGYASEKELLAAVGDISREWYVDPNRRAEFQRLLREQGHVQEFISEIYRHKTRERIWISENARLVHDSFGRPSHYEGTIRECTDTMQRLELEERHARLEEYLPGTLMQLDYDVKTKRFTMPFATAGFERIFDMSPELLRADANVLYDHIHPADIEAYRQTSRDAAREMKVLDMVFRVLRPDGSEVTVQMSAMPERKANGSFTWHAFVMDVTERERLAKRAHHLANNDPVTRLGNRRAATKHLEAALNRARRTGARGAVLFFVLDDFRDINDLHGHYSGDTVLTQVAERLRARADDVGGQVFRFGTDEFALVFDNVAGEEESVLGIVQSVARKVCDDLTVSYEVEGGAYQTTASAGVTLFDGRDFTVNDVLKHADTALQDARSRGPGRLSVYSSQMDKILDRNYTLMNELREAIGTDALRLAYQPQASCAGAIVGAEGLIRWQHKDRGNVSPADFIPAAERSGLILQLTRFVLEEAFTTLAAWQRDPKLRHLTLSVNLSARQFENDSFIEEVTALVDAYAIDPSKLILEMTEHVLANDIAQVQRIMTGLKVVGVRFSLDDFGTGYSSLDQLRQLPFDEVKIDGTFVSELEHRQGDRAIVRSIIAMAKAMGMETVAEWVETEGQRSFLAREGCTTLQGYAFGAAVPLATFQEQVQQERETFSLAAPADIPADISADTVAA